MSAIKVNEIFKSIQGESTFAGLPCVFVRLSGCNLRCTYCDTPYAYEGGEDWNIDALIEHVGQYGCKLVEITGGEPLVQPGTRLLIERLVDKGFLVLVETNGSLDIGQLDPRAHIVMDVKCPSSGMAEQNLWENINHLKAEDEVKFVVGSEEDYLYAKTIIEKYQLNRRYRVLFSVVFGKLAPSRLVEWILADNLDVRVQLQIHKYIWDPDKKGV